MTTSPGPTLRTVADTAHWVALYRARESERPDPLFHDPYARRLAGARGEQIYAALPRGMRNSAWSVVARTVVMDRMIQAEVDAGVTLVVNLAAGLDSRPYRLPLPPGLTWVEVDAPSLLEEKTALLASDQPNCVLERCPLDLSEESPTRELLQRLGERGQKMLVVTEGLLMYLRPEAAASLARTIAAVGAGAWITDIISPGLQRLIDKSWGTTMRTAQASMHFAPAEGVAWFDAHGWRVAECQSTFAAAKRLRRLPWLLRLLAHLPGADAYHAGRPWSGICRLIPAAAGSPAPHRGRAR